MRTVVRAVVLAMVVATTSAHVGDTNTHYRGSAGPYAVQVVVRHPGVVPGLADIAIRVEGDGVREVTVRPVPADMGLDGAPRPDVASPVPGQPGLYAAELWFMTSGTYSVHVAVDGAAGEGVAVVPVISMATRRLPLGAGLAALLIGLGIVLAAGLVSIVRAAVGESLLAPGEEAGRAHRRRGRLASGVAIAVIALVLTGGRGWWGAEEAAYRASMFEPIAIESTVDEREGTLHIAFVDPDWLERRWSPLVPDHGKMMHAFLVRIPEAAAFAHVHPVPTGSDAFRLSLPPLPAGDYALYADVVHETGFAQTLTDTVTIGTTDGAAGGDADDSWWTGSPAAVPSKGSPGVARFADGSTLGIDGVGSEAVVAGRDLMLSFTAREANGEPTALQPYMGMAAHLAVRRDDGAIFVHLHPSGSIASASQRQIAIATDAYSGAGSGERGTEAGDPTADTHVMDSDAAPTLDPRGVVRVPYAFPQPGRYRLFVQTRRDDVVRTAVFDVDVVSGPER